MDVKNVFLNRIFEWNLLENLKVFKNQNSLIMSTKLMTLFGERQTLKD